jgi:hypothetical protein
MYDLQEVFFIAVLSFLLGAMVATLVVGFLL